MANEQNHTFNQQIECVHREIAMRERVYPNWVKLNKMTQQKADYELACMRSVLYTLQNLNRQYEEISK